MCPCMCVWLGLNYLKLSTQESITAVSARIPLISVVLAQDVTENKLSSERMEVNTVFHVLLQTDEGFITSSFQNFSNAILCT